MKLTALELKKMIREEMISEYGEVSDPYAGTETLTGAQPITDQVQADLDNLINQSLNLLNKASNIAGQNGRDDISTGLSSIRTEVGHAISQLMNK